jgi:hypothetical protein
VHYFFSCNLIMALCVSSRHYNNDLAPYLLATRETAFGTLRSMATWLSGVVSNQNQLEADGHFAWVGPSGHSNYSHFTWKRQVVPVKWVRRIPAAAVHHAETQMRKLLDWVKPNWEPQGLSERISLGFGSNWESDPTQLFVEGPNDSESFLTLPSAGLAPFADALKCELADQARLVVLVNDQAQAQQSTQGEFFSHAADVVKASSLFPFRFHDLSQFPRPSWWPSTHPWAPYPAAASSCYPLSKIPVAMGSATCESLEVR